MSLLSFTQVSSCAFSVSLRCHHVSSRFHSGVIMCLLGFTQVSSCVFSVSLMCLLCFTQVSSCVFSVSVRCHHVSSQLQSRVFLVSVRCHHVSWFQSGAIMCLLGAVCVTHPDARLSIAFVGEIYPHSFSASSVSILAQNLGCP